MSKADAMPNPDHSVPDADSTDLTTILVVEDETATRARLARIVAQHARYELAGEVGTLAEARAAIPATQPDVLLLDLGLPDGHGLELIGWLQQHRPGAEVLVISVMGDESSVLTAIEAGAGGYLLKDSRDSEVIAAIDQLRQGGAPLSPAIAVHLMRRLQARRPTPEIDDAHLSPRETELLQLIAKGLSYNEVGTLLGLRYNTVASYAKSLYRKLQVNGRREAVYEAVQMGLLHDGRR